ncbi:leucine rich repeat [Brachionus plicatilis]|uniref:Leucine rich repeat n=1 Tax=Brachionus plicatilis TaxID=10195 RepID=A0A3M7QX72_BRAPC|nr:leucine rich repeat [Brachionus plicatilis]
MIDKVLKFWFGSEDSDLNNFESKPCFCLESKSENIDLIYAEFYDLIKKAENDLLDNWLTDKRGKLAFIILLEQFSQIIHRNSPEELKINSKCVQISLDIIERNNLQSYTLLEQIFVVMPLITSRDLSLATKGFVLFKNIADQCPNKQKPIFFQYVKWAKIYLENLKKYDRCQTFFPYPSIKIKSVSPLLDNTCSISNSTSHREKNEPESSLVQKKILFLHGLRQNSNKLKKRTSNLAKVLRECNVKVAYLDGTHPYRSGNGNNSDSVSAIESQRAWYQYDENNKVYIGLEESIEYVLNYVKLHGPFIGIIGFSQGAVLASLLTKLNPNLFHFVIIISGFKPQDLKYGKFIFSTDCPFDFASMHIYGKNDRMITRDRSEDFSKCFKNPLLFEHPDGHFMPLSWPNEKIADFVKDQIKKNKCPRFSSAAEPKVKVKQIDDAMLSFDLFELQFDELFESREAKEFINCLKFKNLDFTAQDLCMLNPDESLIILYLCTQFSTRLDGQNSENYSNTRKLLKILLDVQEISKFSNTLVYQLFYDKWKLLILLCDSSFCDKRTRAIDLYTFLVEKFFHQILSDLRFIDNQNGSCLIQQLTSVIELECNATSLSDLAKYLPRIRSSIDKSSRIGREIAAKLNLITDENSKIKSYNHYRKCLTNVCSFIENLTKNLQSKSPRQIFLVARHDKKVMKSLLNLPLSDSIVNPVAEPVDVSSHDKMKPLYDWLSENKDRFLAKDNLKFERGTITPDGRLDLCKQVIGPKGIQPLLESISKNENVDRLLLGNNIVGDQGGDLIAEFIKSGSSPLTVWYIAGNNLTAKGIKPIADALVNDTKVTALWLKRNPLKALGMVHIGNLMRYNSAISTLDLLNCGLLDSGVEILMEALSANKTLKNLYLSANGISPLGLKSIKNHWTGHLETLFLGANRIGDDGAKIVADILKTDSKLSRLNMTSSRIGPEGMKYLAQSMQSNSSLLLLDLGYMKASMDVGELGNFIQDEGAEYLAEMVRKNKSLLSLNVNNNHMTRIGIMKIRDAVRDNDSLIQLEFSLGHGLYIDRIIMAEVSEKLKLNKQKLICQKPDFDIEELFIPLHVKEIYSVYRTH